MPVFLVSFDLTKGEHDYRSLWSRLREWGARQVLSSDWLIGRATTPSAIYDDLARYITPNDRVLVLGLTGEAVWGSSGLLLPDHEAKEMLIGAPQRPRTRRAR